MENKILSSIKMNYVEIKFEIINEEVVLKSIISDKTADVVMRATIDALDLIEKRYNQFIDDKCAVRPMNDIELENVMNTIRPGQLGLTEIVNDKIWEKP